MGLLHAIGRPSRSLAVALSLGPWGCDPPEPAQPEAIDATPARDVAAADASVAPDDAAALDPPDSAEPPLRRRAWPPTSLALALLATMDAPDASQSRATIRDEDGGTIASYRPGDRIRTGVEVLAIEDGIVELSNEGSVEYLGISEVPVELAAADVFYPDLLDDLSLSGSMDDGIPLPPAPEYTIKSETYAWGTPRTIGLLREALRSYARGRDVPRVRVLDISRQSGGPFPPHISHQEGRDVDLGYVRNPRSRPRRPVTPEGLDRRHTWELIEALIATEGVLYIFVDYELQRVLYEYAADQGVDAATLERLFQYPHGRRAARGVIRHWDGHRDHFHVRFLP